MKTPFLETPFVLETPHAQLAAVLHAGNGPQIVIMCHGFTGTKSECGRLYVQTARSLQKAGFNVLRFDFMGSGDSSGSFNQMSPNTQIRDAVAVLEWARERYEKIGLLGFSFGGGTAICAAHQAKQRPDTLVTWATVPSFRWWNTSPSAGGEPQVGNPLRVGRRFYTDRPRVDIPEAYQQLKMPRLQIQGDRDIPEFQQRFAAFAPKKEKDFRHLVIPGADHNFNRWEDRQQVIRETVRWMRKYLTLPKSP